MKILMLGGTGVLSSATARQALTAGHDVTVVTRGANGRPVPTGATVVTADITDREQLSAALGRGTWDAVVDFLAYGPTDVEGDVDLFTGRTGHYVLISSASVYSPRPMRIPLRESSPLGNPFWAYPTAKERAERAALGAWAATGFPATVVRPSHTWDETAVPTLGGWTDIARMREGLPVLIHGDGTSVRTLTWAADFAIGLVGLLGQQAALGDSFHITSDELTTWNDIYQAVADAAGADLELTPVSSQTIADAAPALAGPLLGDRANSKIFDNSKIRGLVPTFTWHVPVADGARRLVDHFDRHPELQRRDPDFDRLTDTLHTHARSLQGATT